MCSALCRRSLLSILSDAFGKFIASKLIPLSNIIGEFRLTGYVTAATSENQPSIVGAAVFLCEPPLFPAAHFYTMQSAKRSY